MNGLTLERLYDIRGIKDRPWYSEKFGINFHQCLRELDEKTLSDFKAGVAVLDEKQIDMCNLLIQRGF